ncbi:Uncharacterised protein [Acinetobacter baumannii]|nr:Uncharacterised protein [Acinetobacter baumannii]
MRRRFPAVPIAEKTCLPGSLQSVAPGKPLPAFYQEAEIAILPLCAKTGDFRHYRRWHNRQGVPAKVAHLAPR